MFHSIVVEGALRSGGMIAFPMPAEDEEALHQYIIGRAWAEYKIRKEELKEL
jgi:hypothetical protein